MKKNIGSIANEEVNLSLVRSSAKQGTKFVTLFNIIINCFPTNRELLEAYKNGKILEERYDRGRYKQNRVTERGLDAVRRYLVHQNLLTEKEAYATR